MMNVQQQPGAAGQPIAPFHSASLYIGDLAPDVSEAMLFDIFNRVGPVASIRVCRDTVTRRSLGYAYVNFHNMSDAERALDTMNFTTIKDRPCRIMWSQRDPSLRRSGVGNIFVKNLDPTVDNKALYDTFSLFGNILSCKVATDEASNSKGYGYVHYETAEAANEAISKIDGMLIAGKQVHVGHFVRRMERASQTDWTNLYLKNVPEDWTEEVLEQKFKEYGTITSCRIQTAPTPGPDGKHKSLGFGFVNYDTHEAAQKAVDALNGLKLGEGEDAKELYVGRAQKKSDRERELRGKYEQMKMERMSKYQGVNLYVKNLDEAVSEDMLREAFAPFGTITSARVMKDNNTGMPRGFGFVCFSIPEEATKAVAQMNNKMLASKPIYVSLAQRKEVRRAQLEAQYARTTGMGPRGLPMAQPGMPYGMPYMMAGQPSLAQRGPQQGYPMMPQMMARGTPRGPMGPMYGGRGNYPMPAYAAMPQMPQQQAPQQRRPGGPQVNGVAQPPVVPAGRRVPAGGVGAPPPRGARGPQQAVPPPQAQARQSKIQYSQHARNQPGGPGPMPNQGMPMGGPQDSTLTPAALAAATPEKQKNMIGERLYPLIHEIKPDLAGKITGMLLEMDNSELLHLLESPDALKAKIAEALQVLEQHSSAVEQS